MLIQQQYYTSWNNSRTQKTGFQVKAESIHLTQEMTELLNRLIGYSIPSQLDASDLTRHPVALRYYITDQFALLISSCSSGKDELGRDGNFFAHSLVGTPEQMAYLAPIFYWDSPFWVSQDPSDQQELPELEKLEAEVVFDFDAIWNFLNAGNRKQFFYKLLCAVIDYHDSKRRIIIIDDAESVALWIASICTFLPPSYCYFLSFSTYHHDPGRTPFTITGTTVDSNFRCTSDSYFSYFIVNSQENSISDVAPSDYANYALERLTSEHYEEEVLGFFSWLERIDLTPKLIDRHLEHYVNFYQASTTQVEIDDPKKILDAATFVTNSILARKTLDQEDITDLRSVCEVLADMTLKQPSHEIITKYGQTLRALKQHDSCFEESFDRVIIVTTSLVLMKQQNTAELLFLLIKELYSSNLLDMALHRVDILENWSKELLSSDIEQIAIFWKFLGSKLRLTQVTETFLQVILFKTFTAFDSQDNHLYQIPMIVSEVLNLITAEKRLSDRFLLKVAIDYQQGRKTHVLKWIYYSLVEHCNLQERKLSYWKYWQSSDDEASNLRNYEIRRDLLNSANAQQIVRNLCDWVETVDKEIQSNLLNDTVYFLVTREFHERSILPINMQEIAMHLLTEDILSQRLEAETYGRIFSMFAAKLRICKVDISTLNLYQKLILQFSHSPSNSDQTISKFSIDLTHQAVIQGAIDLTQGKLQESTIPQLHHYFSSMSQEQYKREVKDLIEGFFTSQIDPDSHFKLIRGVYISNYQEDFWDLYWLTFQSQLIDRGRVADIANILDLWFRSSGDLIERYPYVVPEFFAELPNLFETIQSSKNYNKIERNLKIELTRKNWYSSVQKYFQKSRKGFLGNFF